MKKASITEAKNNLSALIDGLKNGSPVLIADRGRPVARLEPARPSDDGADEDGHRIAHQATSSLAAAVGSVASVKSTQSARMMS